MLILNVILKANTTSTEENAIRMLHVRATSLIVDFLTVIQKALDELTCLNAVTRLDSLENPFQLVHQEDNLYHLHIFELWIPMDVNIGYEDLLPHHLIVETDALHLEQCSNSNVVLGHHSIEHVICSLGMCHGQLVEFNQVFFHHVKPANQESVQMNLQLQNMIIGTPVISLKVQYTGLDAVTKTVTNVTKLQDILYGSFSDVNSVAVTKWLLGLTRTSSPDGTVNETNFFPKS